MFAIRNGRNYSCDIQYHIVWCVKNRFKLLKGEITASLEGIIRKIVEDKDMVLLEVEVMEDYVHVLIGASPQNQIPNIIKALKGVSARLLFLRFPEIKCELNGSSLWSSNYFIATPSQNIKKKIEIYLQSQEIQGVGNGQVFE